MYISKKIKEWIEGMEDFEVVYRIGGTIKSEEGLTYDEAIKKFNKIIKEPKVKWAMIAGLFGIKNHWTNPELIKKIEKHKR